MGIYVTSDIHGFYDRYLKLLETIDLKKEDTLYILGDVIDRGPDGIKILQDMMTRKNIVPILGNHEFMMLEYLNGNDPKAIWLREGNGGQATLDEFNKLNKQEQNKIIEYIKSFYLQKELIINEQKFMLCHTFYSAGHKDYKFKEATRIEVDTMIWYSPFRDDELYIPSKYYSPEYVFIVGHVPTCSFGYDVPYLYRNIIDIDGGCALSSFMNIGCLCCLKLDELTMGEEPIIYKIT